MSAPLTLLSLAVGVMCLSPAALLAVLTLPTLAGRPLGEEAVGTATRLSLIVSLLASGVALITWATSGVGPQLLSFGEWFTYGEHGFHLDVQLDGVSLGAATLAVAICAVVAAFSFRYLHLDAGFRRYFVQLALFVLGLTLIALAGSIEVLFAGWELVGLSSALLVGFFHDRRSPVVNALRVFAVYRFSDAAMLSAAVLLHHWAGGVSLGLLFSAGGAEATSLTSAQALIIALLITAAAAGKSALLPFSGWLPRAMEGPTSSSAVYYGALSIHAGCYLLLRAQPLLAHSPLAAALAALAGATTAVYATFTARVQTDIKSALVYASLTQVGIIVVEIALGFTTLALVHMVGHVCLRLLQFLSAPNILRDLMGLEGAGGMGAAGAPTRWGSALYLASLERGFVDPLIDRGVVGPFVWMTARMDRLDRLLSGGVDDAPSGSGAAAPGRDE